MQHIPTEWLKNPQTGNGLVFDEAKPGYKDVKTEMFFPLIDGVTSFLVSGKSSTENQEKFPFNYAEHYQRDAEVFDYAAGWEDPAAIHENRRLREMILSKIPNNAERILDVGCGAAWVAEHFKTSQKTVVSMDVSTANPQKAVRNYPFAAHYGLVADAYHLPFQDEVFDVIVASEIIEHVPDPEAFVASLFRVIKKDGLLIVTTPHNEKIEYSLCIHCNHVTPHDAHLHSFTKEKLRLTAPPGYRNSTELQTFVNKVLLKLRTHSLLKYLPFKAWKSLDNLANKIIAKPARLMMVLKKI